MPAYFNKITNEMIVTNENKAISMYLYDQDEPEKQQETMAGILDMDPEYSGVCKRIDTTTAQPAKSKPEPKTPTDPTEPKPKLKKGGKHQCAPLPMTKNKK